jgi:enoyl-CoA hydratase/carnithine racemase
MEMLMTAEPISAQRAYEVGLVNHVVPAAELRKRTHELALRIVGNAPLSVRAGKAMVRAAAEHPLSRAYEEAEALFEPAYLSTDGLEGPRAFQEKRSPVWRGE